MHSEGNHDTTAQRNASVYYSKDNHHDDTIEEGEDFRLPQELADMIANAKRWQQGSSSPAAAPTSGVAAALEDEAGYYPTYMKGELCSSKPIGDFEGWEESYASLVDCCEAAFSWDYDACVRL